MKNSKRRLKIRTRGLHNFLQKKTVLEKILNSPSPTESVSSKSGTISTISSSSRVTSTSSVSSRYRKRERRVGVGRKRRRRRKKKKTFKADPYLQSLKIDQKVLNYVRDIFYFEDIFLIFMYYYDQKEIIRNLNFLVYFLIQKEYESVDLRLDVLFRAIFEEQEKRKRKTQAANDRASYFFFPDLIRRSSTCVNGKDVYKRIIKNSRMSKMRAAGLHPKKDKKERIEKKHKLRRQRLIQKRIQRKLKEKKGGENPVGLTSTSSFKKKDGGATSVSILKKTTKKKRNNNNYNQERVFFQLPPRRMTKLEEAFFEYFCDVTEKVVTKEILRMVFEKTKRNIIQFIIELQLLFGHSATTKLFTLTPYFHTIKKDDDSKYIEMTKREYWRNIARFLNETKRGYDLLMKNNIESSNLTKKVARLRLNKIFRAYIREEDHHMREKELEEEEERKREESKIMESLVDIDFSFLDDL